MTMIAKLLNADRAWLTDGGLETWLFFQQGFHAPEFAAITLIDDERALAAMRAYFDGFLAMAASTETGFVLDTVTWRGCAEWASKLGMTEERLLRSSAAAVRFAKAIRDDWRARLPGIVLNGVVGPAGDGYVADVRPSAEQALAMHAPQVEVLAQAGVDMISAITMTNTGEAIGVARAVAAVGLPVAISFTVETDGRLPTGQALGEAIDTVDDATGAAVAYYMVNCAHPDHFRNALAAGTGWTARIGGVRANASRLSHQELDAAETLDDGDPEEFGRLHAELAALLPGLRVVGGCCGTDHRHVRAVSQQLHRQAVA